MQRVHRRSERGYVLILTIAGLALLMLAGSFIGQHVSTALRLAWSEKQYAEQERLARDAAAHLTYMFATTKRTKAGLGDIPNAMKLDGTWYQMENGTAVALQDARGLINLVTAPRVWKERLLGTYGIEVSQAQALVDALDDYVDEDNLARLQGAEAEDYQRKGMLPPRNLPLTSSAELLRVYGWSQARSLWDVDGIQRHVIAERGTGINPNTATWRVLAAAFGIPYDIAKELVRQRRLTGLIDIAAYATVDVASNVFSSNNPIRIPSVTSVGSISFPGSKKAWRFVITLTPSDNNGPWRVGGMSEYVLPEAVPERGLPKVPDLSAFRVDLNKEKIELPF